MEALKLKKLRSRLAFAYFVVLVLLLIGCSSTPTIVEVPYPVFVPAIHDTIELVQDTVYAPSDSNAYWEGGVQDSLKNVIGWLKVFYNRKIAELKLNPHTDTVKVPVKVPVEKDKIIQVISGLLPMWAEAILIVVGIILLVFANKNTTILQALKGLFNGTNN